MTIPQRSPQPSGNDQGPENSPSSSPKFTDHGPKREVNPPGNPMANARQLVLEKHFDGTTNLLVFYRGDFRVWTGPSWPVLEEVDLRAGIARFFEHAYYIVQNNNGPVEKPFLPNRTKVNEIVESLKAVTHQLSTREIPSWADPQITIPPSEIIPVGNGLLWLPPRILLAPNPDFLNGYALPYDFDPEAKPPTRWLLFLDEVWKNDEESKRLLQDMMGYLLTADTSQQKILAVIGPKRSGKGTIGGVIRALVGHENVVGLMMKSLGGNFGLQPLINSQVAIISDARIPAANDASVVVERLLSISGEDTLTIDRKYKSAWTGKLPTRLIIMSNELPHLTDMSGALPSRLVVLRMTESFYGREDPGLIDELLTELPGILLWALEGRERLSDRGHFVQPQSAETLIYELAALASPVGAFVDEHCTVGPSERVEIDILYKAWTHWCGENNQRPGTKKGFGADLRAVIPHLETSRGSGQPRKREHVGIGLSNVR